MKPSASENQLSARLGQDAYERRIRREKKLERKQGRISHYTSTIRKVLTMTGTWERGRRNALRFDVTEHEWSLPIRKPVTLLHLTDFHFLPGHPLLDELAPVLARLSWDICVITGDYRFPVFGDTAPGIDGLRRLRAMLDGPAYAILGNHDAISMVPSAEEAGLPFLLNESIQVGELTFVGVDDPAHFRTDDLPRALRGVPNHAVTVMLAHSCCGYREAADAGIHLQLSGHSHGGQFCLPGGFPIIHNLRAPRRMNSGRFYHAKMHGYVSRGTGSCGVEARFFCPPEVALHHLRPCEARRAGA